MRSASRNISQFVVKENHLEIKLEAFESRVCDVIMNSLHEVNSLVSFCVVER
jgi:hypothetical protein